ncbi:Lon family ATP-dependent protease [uncultured Dialister sp.]|uniref:Lon family ATP-dependent protease n=1 Tax=uncultured Dialister sp. TaxID=278064 RepID=UPI0025F754D9|nr:Lon family ATP-dependent protease [uncultured Dialister sp.]
MEDVKDLIGRLMDRVDSAVDSATGSGGYSDGELKRQINAIYSIYASIVGSERIIVQASRFNALKYIHDENPRIRLIGLQRLIMENKDYSHTPTDEEIPLILDQLEDRLAEMLARQAVERQLEEKIADRLEERHQEYVNEIRQEIIEEETETTESPAARHKMEKLEALDKVKLTSTIMQIVRPAKLSEIVGQDRAVRALASRIASPYPQHLILYGPPGVGKTTAARLVLDEAKKLPYTAFGENAPFVECDGTTLRWDERDITNPLIGSVHDPIYQGARRDLADDGIPEPKPGLVTDAHGGILFIDEIGELDPMMLNKLLKVLEDKRVYFESAYYDEEDPAVPDYIRKLFKEGAPADFILIGATTRQPSEINPAIRSRCAEVFFEPLQPDHVVEIVNRAAEKLKVTLEEGVAELISTYTMEGRKAVSLLADAYGLAVYEAGSAENVRISLDLMKRTAQASRLSPWLSKAAVKEPKIGHIYGLGVAGYWGSTIEIEAAAFPAREKGRGTIRFNDTAGSMAKDSVATAAAVVRGIAGKDLSDYDLHVNIIGGGNIDGPSAGCAITCAILSAVEKIPLRQEYAVTGEVSLSGEVKPVGGVAEKAFGARQAGLKGLFVPEENKADIDPKTAGVEVIPVKTIAEVLDRLLVK